MNPLKLSISMATLGVAVIGGFWVNTWWSTWSQCRQVLIVDRTLQVLLDDFGTTVDQQEASLERELDASNQQLEAAWPDPGRLDTFYTNLSSPDVNTASSALQVMDTELSSYASSLDNYASEIDNYLSLLISHNQAIKANLQSLVTSATSEWQSIA